MIKAHRVENEIHSHINSKNANATRKGYDIYNNSVMYIHFYPIVIFIPFPNFVGIVSLAYGRCMCVYAIENAGTQQGSKKKTEAVNNTIHEEENLTSGIKKEL